MIVMRPEAPLVIGLVDELAVKFGPTKAAAELEASKVCVYYIIRDIELLLWVS